MASPIFFIHPPKSGGWTVISFFDLNKGKDQFVNFEWDRQGRESCRARLVTTRIGGGHQPYGMHRNLKSPFRTARFCAIRLHVRYRPDVAIANSPERLTNSGIWRQGWHCV
jgi:hypothetical protein